MIGRSPSPPTRRASTSVGPWGGLADGSVAGPGAFVRKYDPDGDLSRTRLFAASTTTRSLGAAVGATGVYVTGGMHASLNSSGRGGGYGGTDAFLRKYDPDGNEIWSDQFGSAGCDWVRSVSVMGSDVYFGGFTDQQLPDQLASGGRCAYVAKMRGERP